MKRIFLGSGCLGLANTVRLAQNYRVVTCAINDLRAKFDV